MGGYKQAGECVEKECAMIEKLKGVGSREYMQARFRKAVVLGEEGNMLGAI